MPKYVIEKREATSHPEDCCWCPAYIYDCLGTSQCGLANCRDIGFKAIEDQKLVLHPQPDWCPLAEVREVDTCYRIRYNTDTTLLRRFDTLEDAKEWIRRDRAAHEDDRAFEVWEYSTFKRLVYEEE